MDRLNRAEPRWDESRRRWVLRVQYEGHRKAFYSSRPGKQGVREVELAARDWLEDNCPDTIRFNTAWEQYITYKRKMTGTANASKLEQIGRLYILPNIPNKRLASIVAMDWQKCIDAPALKNLSRRTCVNVRATIGQFINYCRLQNWKIDERATASLTIPASARTGERHIVQPDELQILLTDDTIPRYNKIGHCREIHAFRLLVLTGLRRGELCGLKWEDVDRQVIHVHRSINSIGEITQGKNKNARRDVILSSYAMQVLEDQRAMLAAEGIISPWVFPRKNVDTPSSDHLYKAWQAYSEYHNIKASLHELRHTFISIAGMSIPLELLKREVGHSASMDTFGVYGHAIDGEAQRVQSGLDTVFGDILQLPTDRKEVAQ